MNTVIMCLFILLAFLFHDKFNLFPFYFIRVLDIISIALRACFGRVRLWHVLYSLLLLPAITALYLPVSPPLDPTMWALATLLGIDLSDGLFGTRPADVSDRAVERCA